MPADAVRLDRLERWMQAVIIDPQSAEAGVRSRAARKLLDPAALGRVVLPSPTMTSLERVGVYHGMYFLRLRDALAGDYPGLVHFLGEDGFAALAQAYLAVHPSRSYTLNRLGDHLPDFVRKGAPAVRQRVFAHDLARLELAIAKVFDAETSPVLTPEAIAAVPSEAWSKTRFRPVEAFALVALSWPANAYLQSVRDETAHPPARRRATWVAVYRRTHAVWRLELDRKGAFLLGKLASGMPLGRAIAATRRQHPLSEERIAALFRLWTAEGIISTVEVAKDLGRGKRSASVATRRRAR